jgi:hypothetical protein
MPVIRHRPSLVSAIAIAGWLSVAPCHGQSQPTIQGGTSQQLLNPDSPPAHPQSLGKWTLDGHGLRPTPKKRQPKGAFWLLPKSSLARKVQGTQPMTADALINVRLGPTKRREARLLLRAISSKRRVESALVVEMVGRWVWISQLRKGRLRRISRKRKLRRVGLEDPIEVDILLMGPHVLASFFNYAMKDHLGTISARHSVLDSGTIGLMRPRRIKRAAPVSHLSIRPTCAPVPEPTQTLPLFAVHLAQEDASQGKEYATTLLEDLPSSSTKTPSKTVWQMHRRGLEKLLCSKANILRVQTDLPFKYRDLAYLKYRNAAPTETAKGYRLDLSYKDPQMVEALLKGWHRRFPKLTRLFRAGRSHQGRPIWGLSIGRKGSAPTVLLNGAHHGEEILTVEFVLDAIQSILNTADTSEDTKAWLKKLRIVFVPLVNPDGLASFLLYSREGGRKNGLGLKGRRPGRDEFGVDLNRNYPIRWGASGERGSRSNRKSRFYRGPYAASANETRAMMRLAHREHFAASISFHTGTVALLPPYTIPGMKNPKPNETEIIAEELTKDLPEHPQGGPFEIKRMLYPVEGTDQDWLRFTYGTVALLVEGARWSPVDGENRRKVIEAVRPLWKRLLNRIVNGPTLTGTVVDQRGRPLRAEVRLVQQRLRENERWFSRCRDGRFTRLLPRAGSYTVEIRYPGISPIRKKVRVGKGIRRMRIRIPGDRTGPQCRKLTFPQKQP